MEPKQTQDVKTPEGVHFADERVLVTGGGGFIGSAVVKSLLAGGASVVVLDDWSTGSASNLPGHSRLNILNGSVIDFKTVLQAVPNCTVVIHQAATHIPTALEDPMRDCEVNVKGTLNVLLAARDAKTVRRFVYASTDSVYGNPKYLPINEDDVLSPLSPFAVSKLAGENYCRAFYETFGLSTTVLRYGNVYGPNATTDAPYIGVVGRFLQNAKKGLPLQIHGDGEQTRDFVFLSDAVDATLRACRLSKAEGQIYNVGTGIEITVNTLAETVKSVTRSSAAMQSVNRLDIDNIRRRVLNIEKIRRELRWTPRFTLEQGLRQILGTVSR
jgi:UDP-glucose 4-epimerase